MDKAHDEAKKRVLDSLACFYGAFSARPVAILRKTLAGEEKGPCALWGTSQKISPETASWLNGAAVRALDFNDTYLSKEPCHPSDLIATFWAACEISGRKKQGRLLLEAILIGYDAMVRLCDAASLRVRGWDHVTYLPIASALGCSHILGLSKSQAANAVSLALVGNVAMRQTRVGTISDWKAACAAYAARAGLSAARLAKNGFTGPSDIFTGRHGFMRQVSGPFKLKGAGLFFSVPMLMGKNDRAPFTNSAILRTHTKYFPAEHHAQSAIEAALRIRSRIRFHSKNVKKIVIDCFRVAVEIIGSEPEKWRPTTRETADHSLPYLVVAALLDGKLTLEQFEKKRYLDADVRSLLRKVRVGDSKRYSRLYPKMMPSRVTVELQGGYSFSEEVLRPKGYAGRPMSWGEVEEKFRRLANDHLSTKKQDLLVQRIHRLEKVDKLASVAPLMKIVPPRFSQRGG